MATDWDAVIEMDRLTPDEDTLARILAAVGGGMVGPSIWSKRLTIRTDASGANLVTATRAAILSAEAACTEVGYPANAIGIEMVLPDEVERRLAGIDGPGPDLMSTPEVAATLGISEAAVRQRAANGGLGAIKVGDAWVFPRVAVMRDPRAARA